MVEQVLKSPGYYDREIDLSVRTTQPTGTPTTIIGASQRGPAFVPVTLGSYFDYDTKFGKLDPKYAGGYAIQQTLASKQSAVFLRVLGAGANSTTTHFETTRTNGTVVNAGLVLSGAASGITSDNRNKGTVQFIAAKHVVTASEAVGYPIFSDNASYDLSSNFVHLIRAMIFTANDTRVMVLNTNETFSNLIDDAANINDVSTEAEYRKFKLVISSSAGSSFSSDDGYAGIRIFTASLDPSDNCYIGKLLNTDPEKFEEKKHLLYADFAVDAEIACVASGAFGTGAVVVLSGSSNTSTTSGDTTLKFRDMFGRFDTRYTTPKTTWFISQPFGTTEHDLFYVESLDDGAYANTKYKISIQNLKASSDPRNEYGTFSLVIRDFNDTDLEPKVLEQFNNLTLNPSSQNYIGSVIGDKKVVFSFDVEDQDDKKLQITGKYPNKSKYIRVVLSDSVQTKKIPAKCLPFGFRGLEILKTNDALIDRGLTSSTTRLGISGSVSSFPERITGSIVPPIPMRFKVTRGDIASTSAFLGEPGTTEIVDSRFYWGIKFERNTSPTNPNNTSEQNSLIANYTKFLGIKKLDAFVTGSSTDTFNSNKFTLAKIALSNATLSDVTGSAQQHIKEAAYFRSASPEPSNYMITDSVSGDRVSLATILSKGTAADFNKFTEFAKFSTIMAGGFDGVNILDKNSVRFSDKATSTETNGCANASYISPGALSANYSGTGLNNNAINSYRIAIDIATDPLVAKNNVLAIPGQREPLVADYAAEKNKSNGLSFYIMDIPTYNSSNTRIFDGDSNQYIDINKTADNFDSRAIDNNSTAVYFPNFVMEDTVNNRRVTVPASVAGVSAFAFNDKVAYPWFIPAGFNRNALGFVVLPVTKINQADKNKLNDTRINPIVKFPGQGYVLFSQKTLQQGKTSLESINVKRMMIEVKRAISELGNKILFEQNTSSLRSQFIKDASTILSTIQIQKGIELFKVICDDTNNTQQDIESNKLNAQVKILPTLGTEYITMDFVITNTGVSIE